MSISLNTELTGYGIRLTHKDGEFAGDITRMENGHRVTWAFSSPNGVRGPSRQNREAAQYDALAHWEDVYTS